VTVGDDDVVSASSLVLSSGLSYLLQAAKFFTPWRNILRHGVKISPLSGNLGGKPPILFLPDSRQNPADTAHASEVRKYSLDRRFPVLCVLHRFRFESVPAFPSPGRKPPKFGVGRRI